MLFSIEKNLFGLDISDLALRLIKIKKSGKKNIITSKSELVLPEGIIVDGEIRKPDLLTSSIRKLIDSAQGSKINTNKVISVLPGKKTFLKFITLKLSHDNDIAQALKKEMPKHIPLEPDEMYYDWQHIENTQFNNKKSVLIGAAPKKIVDDYSRVLRKAKLFLFVLELEAAAISRSLLDENEQDSGPKIIIDLGATRTSLVLYHHSTILFTVSIPISGNKITQEISKKLKLNLKQAEKIKKVCGLDEKRCQGSLKKILFSTINDIIANIENAIDFYQQHFNRQDKIQEIILCGGGANLINFDHVMSSKLKIPTKIGNPMRHIHKLDKGISISPSQSNSYATAIGLALRAVNQEEHFE